jgi:HPt (histidine-containing phosphotransfer) domain-containing protein
MALKQLYDSIGGDYNDILSRFGSDSLIERFIIKFQQETSFQELKKAMNDKDWYQSFLACHTLKGVCLNLSFSSLLEPVCKLTEELRGSNKPTHLELLDEIEIRYNHTIEEINNYFNQ